MIFLQDDDTKQQFMEDTGAVCIFLPHLSKAQPAGPQLSGANGRTVPSWGTIRRLSFGLRAFFVTFFLAAVYRPILGLDFLSSHGLLVDPVGRQVLDSKTLKPLSKTPTAAGTLLSKFAAALCSITPSVRSLLASFPTMVGDGKGKPSPKHKIRHTIETTGRPVFAKARRLDPDKLRKAEAEFVNGRTYFRVNMVTYSRKVPKIERLKGQFPEIFKNERDENKRSDSHGR
jgi:hypothetical protein